MAANATAKVTVKLLDQLTAPANIVRNSLRGIRGDMQALSGARLGITRRIEEASKRAGELRNRLLAIGGTGVIAGLGLKKVLKPGTDFETILLDIAQKADLSDEKMKALGERITAIGPQVNRGSNEVAKGVDFLLGMGMDVEKALSITPNIGKTATAYRAEVEDLSKASFSVIDNMKVPIDKLGKALDVMAQGGKEGAFELKDMAREFPSLTASAEALGMRGVDGVAKLTAALQIARKGAADGSEAATNTANLMQKIISPETTKKFKKVGIDIRKELKKTQQAGGDPFIMIAEQIKKATKGDLAKLGDFFEDAQVQKFLRPLIANLEEYKRIRDKSAGASGVVDADFDRRMKTFQSTIDKVMASFERLSISVGTALIPYLTTFGDKLAGVVDWTTKLVDTYPNFTAAVVGATAALLGLAAIAGIVKLLGAGLSLFSLKGLRGLLNYLAPKGAAAAAATAGAGAAAKAAAGAAEAGGKGAAGVAGKGAAGAAANAGANAIKTANAARPLTAAELHAASKGTAAINAAHAAKVAEALGDVGATTTKSLMAGALRLVSKLSNIAAVAEITHNALESYKPTTPENYFYRNDPNFQVDYERSRREQDERRRDPEGARGRAMQQRDRNAEKAAAEPQVAVSQASVGADSRATGTQAGADVGQGIKEGLAAQQPAIQAAAQAIMSTLTQMFAAGITVPVRPKLQGVGAALSGIHSDTGID